jgi:6-pyruvoyltetrahydropterin/6-carboxytetrahydropterin synthase
MVVDFNDIKRVIQAWIDQELDHRMLLNRLDPLVKPLQDLGEPIFLMDENPTAENIAKLIYRYAVSQGFAVTQVKLWETLNSFAVYERAR